PHNEAVSCDALDSKSSLDRRRMCHFECAGSLTGLSILSRCYRIQPKVRRRNLLGLPTGAATILQANSSQIHGKLGVGYSLPASKDAVGASERRPLAGKRPRHLFEF